MAAPTAASDTAIGCLGHWRAINEKSEVLIVNICDALQNRVIVIFYQNFRLTAFL